MTPSKGKHSDSSDSRKHYSFVMTFSVDSFGLLFLFFPFFSPSVVVIDFIGTMKAN